MARQSIKSWPEKNAVEIYSIHNEGISDCNWTRTQNHLARKQTLNHLAKLI